MISTRKLFTSLLDTLTPRQKEVVIGRFGLDGEGKTGETLAAIGDRMNVTRERIRQIEESAMELVNKQISVNPGRVGVLERSKKYLKEAGGVMKTDLLLNQIASFAENLDHNHMAFLLEASRAFHFYPEDDDFWPFYYLGKNELKSAVSFIDGWTNFLKNNKAKVLSGSYRQQFQDFIKTKLVDKKHAENYLSISKRIRVNPYNDIGLKDWPEINPATTKDRVYLVLKKKQKPLHFEDIAKAINEVGFVDAQVALAPTVHNELIKDSRFVLVGRGIYGLKEYGYEPGIAREVIRKVLKHNGPLTPNEVVSHVKSQRFFKPNTILINLQNKNFFERLSDGRYRVRES